MNSNSQATGKRGFDPVLTLIVVLAAAGGGALVVWAKNWVVMPDELIYVELSRSIAHSIVPLPSLQGEWGDTYQVLYPTLIAPLVGLLKMPDAYPWIAVLNAWVMATAAIPAYLLTTYATGSRTAARWVALCTAVTPWLTFASKTLPDATAYAAATWALYAIARTAAPRARAWRSDLLALLAILGAFLVRNQFLALAGVWVGVVVLSCAATAFSEGGWSELWRRLIRLPISRPLPIFTFVFVVLLLKFEPGWLLGFYAPVSTVASDAVQNEGLPQELINHASVVGFGVAALPVVLGLPWLLTALTRIKQRGENDVAILIALGTAAILYVGASFDMRFDPTDRVIERYIFYVAPLLFTAMAGFFCRPPKNLLAFALPAMLGTLVLVATHPYGLDTKLNYSTNRTFSPTQIVLIGWQKAAEFIGTSITGLVILLMLVICAFCWWAVEHGRTAVAQAICFTLVATALIAGTVLTVPGTVDAQNAAPEALFGKRDTAQKAWVQTATGGEPYAIAYAPRALLVSVGDGPPVENRIAWRDAVYWNKGLKYIYVPFVIADRVSTPFPAGKVFTVLPNWETGKLTRAQSDDTEYLLMTESDPRFAPQTSTPPIHSEKLVLYESGADPYAAWAIRGLTPSGWIAPGDATLRLWPPRGSTTASNQKIKLTVSTPKKSGDLKGFPAGADDVRRSTSGRTTTFTWTTKVPVGGHADFKLVRGDAPVHVDRVVVTEN